MENWTIFNVLIHWRDQIKLHKELIWNKTKTSAIQDGKINLLQFTFHVSAEAAIY